jgi:ATP-dependent Clp protease adaptor protein ClpS
MSKETIRIDHESDIATKERQKVEEPPLFKVFLHNDDYTTMDFVVMVLQAVFNKDAAAATEIMLNVHKKGLGLAGVYTMDVAETKVAVVHDLSRKNEHPLRCTMEKA